MPSPRSDEERLDALLGLDADLPPRPGFDTRFFARLAAHKAARRRFWRLALGGLAAAAAVLLVVLAVGPARDVDELALAGDLELLEELDLVRHLDEVEAFEVLARVDPETFERLSRDVAAEAPR